MQNKKHHKSGAFYFGRSDWVVIPTAMRRAISFDLRSTRNLRFHCAAMCCRLFRTKHYFIMCGRTAQFRPQKIPCCFCMVYFSGRSDWVRTSDLYVPNVALYQAELHSENNCIFTRRCRLCNEQVEKAISFISLLYL